jgi:hypothetical protein
MFKRISQWFKESAMMRALRKHVSKTDLAFIAAGYAFPLLGTGPAASMIVTIKIAYKYFCRLLTQRRLSKAQEDQSRVDE